MAMIVLMEDDAASRVLVGSVLKKEGHEVLTAENGEQGLVLVEARVPDLIVSDVQMPGMNGFQMLTALRSNPAWARIPVILLTSLQERAHMRIGMNSGADDYITKPFRPQELKEAVAAQLNKQRVHANLQALAVNKAVSEAVADERDRLMQLYEAKLAAELSDRWPTAQQGEEDERFDSATILFVDIPNYGGVAEKLSAPELTQLVRKFYGRANDTTHLFGARHMQFIGEGLLAVFTNDTNTETVNHGLRAVRTALALLEAAHGINRYLDETYPGRQLPQFKVNVGLNTGAVTITNLHDALHGGVQKLPVGEATSTAMLLQKQAAGLGWPIAASVATIRTVTGAVITGRRGLLEMAGRSNPVDAAEITGLDLESAY